MNEILKCVQKAIEQSEIWNHYSWSWSYGTMYWMQRGYGVRYLTFEQIIFALDVIMTPDN